LNPKPQQVTQSIIRLGL